MSAISASMQVDLITPLNGRTFIAKTGVVEISVDATHEMRKRMGRRKQFSGACTATKITRCGAVMISFDLYREDVRVLVDCSDSRCSAL